MRMSDLHEHPLANGLRAICMPHGDTPLAEVRLVVPELSDTPRALFEAQLRAHLATLHEGDPWVRLSDLEQSAVVLGGSASPWATVLSGSCGVDDLPRLLRHLSGAVTSPVVAAEVTEQEYATFAAQTRASAAYPHVLAADGLYRHLYGGHAAGNRAGAARVEAAAPVEDASVASSGRLGPREALLLVVGGGLDPAEVFQHVEEHFGGWDGATPGWVVPEVPALRPGPPAVVDLPGSSRAHVRLRAEAVPHDHELYPPLFLALNTLSGGAVSTRLTRNLRNDNGYVYGASAFIDSFPGANLIAVEAETSVTTAHEVLAGIEQELRGMAEHPPGEEEFRAAQRFAAGCMRTRLTSQAEVSAALTDLALNGADPMELAGFGAQLSRVTYDEVVDVAREYFAPDRFTGVVCGDASLLGSPALIPNPTPINEPIEKVAL
ncbi:M16 family metallopeptidase [Nocardiopsis valliformis]|uniref:M16 family metallopeptidase n=1 Tax=Nocardiopsis valliformis TaxID=239974 RepID=UPI00034DF84D|nr:insulinase family protein [Nocardiopsis valliformis]